MLHKKISNDNDTALIGDQTNLYLNKYYHGKKGFENTLRKGETVAMVVTSITLAALAKRGFA